MSGWAEFYRNKTLAYGAHAAKPSDWKCNPAPPPSLRADLRYQATYTDEQYAVLAHGFVPQDMDERWFVVLDNGWLNLYRSWSGSHIYGLHLARADGGGWTVDESWVTRNPEEYRPVAHGDDGMDFERDTVTSILKNYCFKQHEEWLKVKAEEEQKAKQVKKST
ncbi:hypothetical protein A1Q2_01170 [Trichosporon asahii var. asahii CBS 8904]|uniref:Uncharacterized protein n=2 Tax=Trichosporon asahii var. asahii TaxID=189963 RepID=K1WUE5_TRIAC|nr:hypothetical protein A1Q1_04946 [Trichosporon asahii var. asahii CBS 2479]EJT46457.1 hypothetical protein A1Q1_04946 [Trichosporon asahii var. asahii CBS 2479]EKD04519.1 hypothetical protein A1Q2_01170 [Trichosporon asahii var. asahii CBS 8904]